MPNPYKEVIKMVSGEELELIHKALALLIEYDLPVYKLYYDVKQEKKKREVPSEREENLSLYHEV